MLGFFDKDEKSSWGFDHPCVDPYVQNIEEDEVLVWKKLVLFDYRVLTTVEVQGKLVQDDLGISPIRLWERQRVLYHARGLRTADPVLLSAGLADEIFDLRLNDTVRAREQGHRPHQHFFFAMHLHSRSPGLFLPSGFLEV